MAAEASLATFRVEHKDKASGVVKSYNLSYYADGTVSMYDLGGRRMYLKRSPVPEKLALRDFYLDATVIVCGRPLHVADYADDATRSKFAATRGTSLLLVKPDAYHAMGKVLVMVRGAGLEVGRLRMVKLSRVEAAEFLALGRRPGAPPAGDDVAAHLASDHALAVEVTGDDVIAAVHALAGPADPADARSAAPASIRAVFGADKLHNAVHVPATPEGAAAEIGYLFDRRYSYTAVGTHCAALLIKPHAVAAGAVGGVLDRVLEAGLEVSALRSVGMTRSDATDYLEAYRGVVAEYERWVTDLASGQSVAVEVRGEDCVHRLRELAGPYDTVIARELRPGTLRATFGTDAVRNGVHVTDLPADGPLEVKFFFTVLD
jgi:nucleoside-diphosphate kinase